MNATLKAMLDEAERANEKYGPPTSTQEALGVLIEEVDELKHAIHMNKAGSIELEAIQVAAVAYRLALSVASSDMSFRHRSGLRSE